MRIADMNQKTMIDLIDWARHSIVSLLEQHSKWVCFNDIQQEEIDLKRLMKWVWNALCQEESLKCFMSRRNRLETSDEMSLKRLMK